MFCIVHFHLCPVYFDINVEIYVNIVNASLKMINSEIKIDILQCFFLLCLIFPHWHWCPIIILAIRVVWICRMNEYCMHVLSPKRNAALPSVNILSRENIHPTQNLLSYPPHLVCYQTHNFWIYNFFWVGPHFLWVSFSKSTTIEICRFYIHKHCIFLHGQRRRYIFVEDRKN